jgi:phospholipid/cholesterol/gamma-HCH transport system substrate-binding protein
MAIKSFRDFNPLFVGTVSIIVLAVAVTVSFLTGTLGLLSDRYTMTGIFAGTGGLRSGNDVQVAGVRIGKVSAVEPDFHRGNVRITWKVDRKVDLGPGTRAEVRMSNILGGHFLRLSGPVGEPYMSGVPERRRTIPLERTAIPTTFNDVLDSGSTMVSRIDARTISKVLDQVRGISRQGRGRLGGALENLTTLADTINNSDPQIQALLTNGDKLVRLVNAKDRQLSQLARNATVLLDQLRQRQAELSVLLGSGDSTVRGLSRLITTKQSELIAVINDLGGTMRTLEPQIDEINETLAWMGPVTNDFASAGAGGPFMNAVFSQIGPLAARDVQELARLLKQGRTAP